MKALHSGNRLTHSLQSPRQRLISDPFKHLCYCKKEKLGLEEFKKIL